MNQHMSGRSLTTKLGAIAAAALIGGGAGAVVDHSLTSEPASSAAPAAATTTAQPAAIKQSATTLTALYKQIVPSVVDITVTSSASSGQGGNGISPFPGAPQQQQTQAEGSGFVYDASGDIVTNDHVVAGATSIKVKFSSGASMKATVVGTDPSTDLAVIKVASLPSGVTPLQLGSSIAVEPGQAVAAFGSPFGLAQTMTAGIVSAVGRSIQAPNNYTITGAIQTDAAINHGNSGGPLVDMSGKVIGVDAQIESDSGDNAGVGFAIPSDTVKSVVGTLVAHGTVKHAYLGVSVQDAASGGATIGTVQSGSPAATAGLQAGDVVTAVDGKTVASADVLTAEIGSRQPGDKVTLTIERGGSTRTISVTLGTRPS